MTAVRVEEYGTVSSKPSQTTARRRLSNSGSPATSTMTDTKPAKRKRTDSLDSNILGWSPGVDPEEAGAVTQSREHWFNDGNIILQAESKRYRVHQSVLKRYSSWFDEALLFPQPAEAEIQRDDCPFFVLGDTTEDIDNMLTLLYDTMSVSVFRGISVSVLGTMLRLGRKYSFKIFWDEAVKFLEKSYPDTLCDWDGEEKQIYDKFTDNNEDALFGVIALAHEFGLKSVLPTAYVSVLLEYDSTTFFAKRRVAWRVEEPLNCLLAREKIYNAITKHPLSWLHESTPVSKKCVSRAGCTSVKHAALIALLKGDHRTTLQILVTGWCDTDLGNDFCKECSPVVEKIYNEGRKKVWHLLPEYLGLENEVWNTRFESPE
ncbi:unnamed protein product [Cyclocybe aegerita]|uniref:BTB domain-containing protein n=1 Tax=Cyclocybe aegerita TaxID=1973307 RepID=A0A8S0WMI5_CYCAE|nr:unnamed protein product [Cyclocybe aegerita]